MNTHLLGLEPETPGTKSLHTYTQECAARWFEVATYNPVTASVLTH
jgi:hypothetical protein